MNRASFVSFLEKNAHLRKPVAYVISLVVLGLMIRGLVGDWRDLPQGFFQTLRYDRLLVSFGLLLLAMICVSLRWFATLRLMGVQLHPLRASQIWFLSQAGRYVPGGVWTYLGRYHLGSQELSGDSLVVSMFLETVLRVVSELLVSLIGVVSLKRYGAPGWVLVLSGIAGAALVLVALNPCTLRWLADRPIISRRWPGAADLVDFKVPALLLLLVYYTLTVVLVGVAFCVLVSAFQDLAGISDWLFLTSTLAASVVLGFLVPIAPGGLGIREGLMVFLLKFFLAPSISVLISLFSRVWLTLADLVLIGIAFGLRVADLRE